MNCKKDIKQDDKFCPNCGEKNYRPDFVLSGQPQKISFWTKNTLIVILPLAVFATLRGELSVPSAMLIGLIVGGVVRFLYSFFENKSK